jgi:hypothetical protein
MAAYLRPTLSQTAESTETAVPDSLFALQNFSLYQAAFNPQASTVVHSVSGTELGNAISHSLIFNGLLPLKVNQ